MSYRAPMYFCVTAPADPTDWDDFYNSIHFTCVWCGSTFATEEEAIAHVFATHEADLRSPFY
jgi:hypothetical protein